MQYILFTILVSIALMISCGSKPKVKTEAKAAKSQNVANAKPSTTTNPPTAPFHANFTGVWTVAEPAANGGKLTPVLCEVVGEDGVAQRLNVGSNSYTNTITVHIGSKDCKGTETLTITETFKAFRISKTTADQTFQLNGYAMNLVVKGAKAAAALNNEFACGRNDWAAKTYQHTDAQFKTCFDDIESNTGSYLFQIPIVEDFNLMQYRFKVENGGVGFALKDLFEGVNGAFETESSYARLPAGQK